MLSQISPKQYSEPLQQSYHKRCINFGHNVYTTSDHYVKNLSVIALCSYSITCSRHHNLITGTAPSLGAFLYVPDVYYYLIKPSVINRETHPHDLSVGSLCTRLTILVSRRSKEIGCCLIQANCKPQNNIYWQDNYICPTHRILPSRIWLV